MSCKSGIHEVRLPIEPTTKQMVESLRNISQRMLAHANWNSRFNLNSNEHAEIATDLTHISNILDK